MMQNLFIFLMGAAGYGLMEIIWRGYTHWTMLLLGGFCFMMIIYIDNTVDACFIAKCIICSAAITSAEFISGLIVNIVLRWDIWDYGDMAFNLLGQVCLPYSVLWAFLSASVMVIHNMIKL